MSYRITVIGTGYLGATHAACMAELGFDVLGVDFDPAKVASLNDGRVPFFEPELEPLLRKHVESGRLRFTTSYQEAAEFGDVHFLCVGTPQRDGEYAADMSYVDAAIEDLVPLLTRPALIVGKSTVPVGTAGRLADRIAELAPPVPVELAWSPEFTREGLAVEDTLRPNRLVFGVRSEHAEKLLREVFAPVIDGGSPVVVCDYATAELAKVGANSFLATKISYINALAELCDTTGADVTLLADALGHDERIGRQFLNAGLGYGGGCLPKDLRAFMARAGELGAEEALTFLREVDAINMRRRQKVVDVTADVLGNQWIGKRVAVLGAAFKPNTDDIRDSPALNVAGRIHLHGAAVSVYDPKAMDNARRSFPTLRYAESVMDACQGAHVVLHLTAWQEFRELDPAVLAKTVATPNVIDGQNCLDRPTWRRAGWSYRGLGRS
ncbi:UDPglucose 6-dehydrogenase [Actinopolymorpha cephalotaxi]|uniref:UDP-glucose 6-dehydrogenase n=1 Tax=Actinopolymorpha cephalotaxi TaxID=504797 RepID=A0A1I2KTK0_9ACTN|nr:UDP-glucose/GDP-mannose dehydrogenase family protein [Actinopolymorpha cephalotaxi]NYH84562.1 UDPglucose 6-dehydrogenase [Actinopolymorpha cephalotaxi]SFF68507.1 UDPglucose 6-dehydrogenase [Actinopolymorpha cephalotaxi]